jgi:hypothetical protein
MRVTSSIYNWHPGCDGSMFDWGMGEIVEFTAASSGKKYEVRIDSELMSHSDSPSGQCYECVFLDGSGRWALDPTNFAPTGERLAKIGPGQASLGLPVTSGDHNG